MWHLPSRERNINIKKRDIELKQSYLPKRTGTCNGESSHRLSRDSTGSTHQEPMPLGWPSCSKSTRRPASCQSKYSEQHCCCCCWRPPHGLVVLCDTQCHQETRQHLQQLSYHLLDFSKSERTQSHQNTLVKPGGRIIFNKKSVRS